LPLRSLLALLIGIGLVFFLDYLDSSVRDRGELETMGFAILGEIPKHGSKYRLREKGDKR
jgi:capsular polysaccharide biosynthesis protein